MNNTSIQKFTSLRKILENEKATILNRISRIDAAVGMVLSEPNPPKRVKSVKRPSSNKKAKRVLSAPRRRAIAPVKGVDAKTEQAVVANN